MPEFRRHFLKLPYPQFIDGAYTEQGACWHPVNQEKTKQLEQKTLDYRYPLNALNPLLSRHTNLR